METQKLHDIEQWLSKIPDGQVCEKATSFTEENVKFEYHARASTNTALTTVVHVKPSLPDDEQRKITKYRYYAMAACFFGVLSLLNGGIMTPLGFGGYEYWDYYPFDIFGPIFLVVGTLCLCLSLFFYCKRRTIIRQTIARSTTSTVSSCGKQERTKYKRSGIFTLCFGALLLVNGLVMTFLFVDESDDDNKYYPFEIFGPTLMIFGATCIVVSLFLFHNMRNAAAYAHFDFTHGKYPYKKKTTKSSKHDNAQILAPLTNTDGLQATNSACIQGNNKEERFPSKRESDASSFIWMKIDERKT